MSVKRIEGPTPAGGAYADIYEVNGVPVEAVEYDAAGNVLLRSYFETPEILENKPDAPVR